MKIKIKIKASLAKNKTKQKKPCGIFHRRQDRNTRARCNRGADFGRGITSGFNNF